MVFKGNRNRRYSRNFFLNNLFMKIGGQYTFTIGLAVFFAALIFGGVITYQNTDENDLLARGQRQVIEQKIEAARQTLETLVANHSSYQGHVELGKVYLDLGRDQKNESAYRKKAEYHFRKAAELKPRNLNNSSAEIASSKLAIVRHQYQEGEEQLLLTYKKLPNDRDLNKALYELYFDWGNHLEKKENYLDSMEKYEQALSYVNHYDSEKELKEKLIAVISKQAIQKEKEKKLDEAIVLLERSLRYQYDVDTLAKMAEMYERDNQTDKAIIWYRKAFDANPDEMSIKLARMLIAKGKSLLGENKGEEAEGFFEEADRVFKMANLPLKDIYPVELSEFNINIQNIDYETGTLLPVIHLKIQNKAHRPLNFLAARVTFLSDSGVINEVTEIVSSIDLPLGQEGKASLKSLTIKPDKRINVHAIKSQSLRVKVSIAYTQDDQAEWEVIGLKEIKIQSRNPTPETTPSGYSA